MLVIIIILLLIFIFLFIIPFGEETELIAINEQEQNPLNYTYKMQFYPNMRYPDSLISYQISDECNEKKTEQMKRAFQILEEQTFLQFTEKTNNPEIEISCSEKDIAKKGYFIAGEGGPNTIINTSLYNVILNGTILLYKESSCREPILQLHELLHALGFDHSENKNSVMYPIQNCKQQLTQEIIDEINRLYSIPSKPDLIFTKIIATKRGRYINFNISVKNIGLKTAENADINVYTDEKQVWNYDLGELLIGVKKEISVKSVTASRNFEELKFIIDEENKISELNEKNNIRILITENSE